MSTDSGGSVSCRVALITPPSDIDYAASVTTILHERHSQLAVTRHDPTTATPLPTGRDADLLIVTGSTARVHDDAPWIDRLATHLRQLVDAGTPVLGVCFGHQLLATSLGGTVATLETRAAGYREITATVAGRQHLLFDDLPQPFTAFCWHRDHVIDLPEGATVLARNETGIQAVTYQDRPAFGIQFHPEVGLAAARTLTASRAATTLGSDTNDPVTEVAASRAARARHIYENALRATNHQNSRV